MTIRQLHLSPHRHRRRRSFGSVPHAHEHHGSVNSTTSTTAITLDAMR
jgi:hypothetical protein